MDIKTSIEQMTEEEKLFYMLTGAFMRKWSEVEICMCFPLALLLGLNQLQARVILNSIRSFDGKRRLIEQLSATYGDEILDSSILKVMQKAKKLSRNRNMLAHHIGGVSQRSGQLTFMTDVADDSGMKFLKERTIDTNTIKHWIETSRIIVVEISDLTQDGVRNKRVYSSPKTNRLKPSDTST